MKTLRGMVYTEQFVFRSAEVAVEGSRIKSVRELPLSELTPEEKDRRIWPGLVDIHFHGCIGQDTCNGSADGLLKMLRYECEHGVTSCLPTTMTLAEETLLRAAYTFEQATEFHKAVAPLGGNKE